MIDLPAHPSISKVSTYYERGLWIAARETLAITLYRDFHRNEDSKVPAFWARGEDVKDHWRKQAQDMMTEGTG